MRENFFRQLFSAINNIFSNSKHVDRIWIPHTCTSSRSFAFLLFSGLTSIPEVLRMIRRWNSSFLRAKELFFFGLFIQKTHSGTRKTFGGFCGAYAERKVCWRGNLIILKPKLSIMLDGFSWEKFLWRYVSRINICAVMKVKQSVRNLTLWGFWNWIYCCCRVKVDFNMKWLKKEIL